MADLVFHEQLKGVVLDALALGVMVVDDGERLVYANAAADRILADRFSALKLRAGKVIMAPGAARAVFRESVAQARDPSNSETTGDYMRAAGGSQATDLAIRVLPARGASVSSQSALVILLVRIIEADRNLEIEARRLFGLTKAEARFAAALASGLSVDKAAEIHAVSPSTVRTHLKNVFRKIGVHRQSQVAALLCGAHIPVEAPTA